MQREITGWHVAAGFTLAFATILTVNLILAFDAVRTFPGMEVENSYVASQAFDAERAAQIKLNWAVSAAVLDGQLRLQILQKGAPIAPRIESAIFGRPTSVAADQTPDFAFDGAAYVAKVSADLGNWNLRVKLRADDGTLFQQRISLTVNE